MLYCGGGSRTKIMAGYFLESIPYLLDLSVSRGPRTNFKNHQSVFNIFGNRAWCGIGRKCWERIKRLHVASTHGDALRVHSLYKQVAVDPIIQLSSPTIVNMTAVLCGSYKRRRYYR